MFCKLHGMSNRFDFVCVCVWIKCFFSLRFIWDFSEWKLVYWNVIDFVVSFQVCFDWDLNFIMKPREFYDGFYLDCIWIQKCFISLWIFSLEQCAAQRKVKDRSTWFLWEVFDYYFVCNCTWILTKEKSSKE